jgi:hypothetical protein
MPLALDQAHALLIAELSRDAATIAEAISAVLAMSLETNLFEVEEVFRDAGSPVYLIAKPELTIVFGMPAWRSALDRLDMSALETVTRWQAARLNRLTSRARPAANAPHEMHFRRVRRDVEALVAGLAENIPAHTDARFVVETMGTAIRALLGIERDHNAHMVGDPARYLRS